MSENQPIPPTKTLWKSNTFRLTLILFVIEALRIISAGDYTDWKVTINTVIIATLYQVVRFFFADQTITLK
jgi:hypothetical protein